MNISYECENLETDDNNKRKVHACMLVLQYLTEQEKQEGNSIQTIQPIQPIQSTQPIQSIKIPEVVKKPVEEWDVPYVRSYLETWIPRKILHRVVPSDAIISFIGDKLSITSPSQRVIRALALQSDECSIQRLGSCSRLMSTLTKKTQISTRFRLQMQADLLFQYTVAIQKNQISTEDALKALGCIFKSNMPKEFQTLRSKFLLSICTSHYIQTQEQLQKSQSFFRVMEEIQDVAKNTDKMQLRKKVSELRKICKDGTTKVQMKMLQRNHRKEFVLETLTSIFSSVPTYALFSVSNDFIPSVIGATIGHEDDPWSTVYTIASNAFIPHNWKQELLDEYCKQLRDVCPLRTHSHRFEFDDEGLQIPEFDGDYMFQQYRQKLLVASSCASSLDRYDTQRSTSCQFCEKPIWS